MNENFEFYKNLVEDPLFNKKTLWDLVIITAINEKQKLCYEKQIEFKLNKFKLPTQFSFLVTNDPINCKIGSGGSTLNVIRQLYEKYGDDLYKMKILLIHAGGYSQRMPSCSILGKIFHPIASNNEFINDMLDMKLAIYTPFAINMSPGIFLTSSDDIETFNFNEQIEASKLFNSNLTDFILIAHKSTIHIAKDHGCYGLGEKFNDTTSSLVYECDFVLQKPSIDLIKKTNLIQIDENTNESYVYTDSVFYFTHKIIHELLVYSRLFYEQICDLNIEVDAYRDFLQPLGAKPIELDNYLSNLKCLNQSIKRNIFENLYKIMINKRSLIVALENSIFYHLGTINELLDLYLGQKSDEYFLNFRLNINFSKIKKSFYADNELVPIKGDDDGYGCLLNSIITKSNVKLSKTCLLEYCYFNINNSRIRLIIDDNCYLNNCYLNINEIDFDKSEELILSIPSNICLHTAAVSEGDQTRYVTVFYSKNDNIKSLYSKFSLIKFLNKNILPDSYNLIESKYDRLITVLPVSDANRYSIWNLKLFKSESTMSRSFINAVDFINNYLNCKTIDEHLELFDKILNEKLNNGSVFYSLLDLISYCDFESMIRYRNNYF